ncbi:unnamed protein product [Closterium sp. NIES-53]
MERAGMPVEDRRRSPWTAVSVGEPSGRQMGRETETRRCHRCGQEGHLHWDCSRPPKCDHCQEEGHLRRECPEIPSCGNCGRRGHRMQDCYSRRFGSARPKSKKDLESQLHLLQARIRELEGGAHKEPAMMVKFRGYAAEPEQEMTSHRHPKERMVCQPSVLTIEKGGITVGGVAVAQAIIDTGAHHFLLGKDLAQRLELDQPNRLITQGIMVMTAEGGEPKWMACTRMPVEVILRPGTKDECRIRMRCGISPSEDYDLLIVMELLYRIGATICTWQEKVLYSAQYWRDDGPVGTLPVHFVKREPRGAFQARMAEMDEQLEDWSWKQFVLERELRKVKEERDERPLALPPRLTDMGRLQEPLTIVEIFGGIGTGLAAALKAGGCSQVKKVRRYWQNGESDPVLKLDHPSQFHCNEPELPQEAWPTLVAQHEAHRFVWSEGLPGPGMVYDRVYDRWEEPSAKERELAMGFLPDATSAKGVGEAQRREALGRAMDAEAMQWLVHVIQMHLASKQLEMEAEVGGPGDDTKAKVSASQQRAEQILLEIQVERQQQQERGWALMAMEVTSAGGTTAEGSWIEPQRREEGERSETQAEDLQMPPATGEEVAGPGMRQMPAEAPAARQVEGELHWEVGEGLTGELREQMWVVLKENR